jgi:hypothetical protein
VETRRRCKWRHRRSFRRWGGFSGQRNATIDWKRRCQRRIREARFRISSDPGIPEGGAQNENKVRRDQLYKCSTKVCSARKVSYECRHVDVSWLEIQGANGSRASRDARCRLELTAQLISHITAPRFGRHSRRHYLNLNRGLYS